MKYIVLLLFLINLIITPALAVRPLSTDDAGILSIDNWEIETGASVVQAQNGTRSKSSVLQVKKGIADNFDFAIELPYSNSQPAGLNDIVLHGKYKLGGNEIAEFSTRLDIKLANADQTAGLGSGYIDYSLLLINTTQLGNISVHSNLIYNVVGTAPNSANADFWSASLAKEVPIVEHKLYLVSEIKGDNSADPNSISLLVGGYLALSENTRIDIGAEFGLNPSADKEGFTAGYTIEL